MLTDESRITFIYRILYDSIKYTRMRYFTLNLIEDGVVTSLS